MALLHHCLPGPPRQRAPEESPRRPKPVTAHFLISATDKPKPRTLTDTKNFGKLIKVPICKASFIILLEPRRDSQKNVSSSNFMIQLDAECQKNTDKRHQKRENSSQAMLELWCVVLGYGFWPSSNIDVRNLQFGHTHWKWMSLLVKQWNKNRQRRCFWNSETPFSRARYTQLIVTHSPFLLKVAGCTSSRGPQTVKFKDRGSGFHICISGTSHQRWHVASDEYMFIKWMNVCPSERLQQSTGLFKR